MRSLAAVLLIACFAALSMLHVYWIFRPVGAGFIPTREGKAAIKPGPLVTAVVAFLLSCCALQVYWLDHPAYAPPAPWVLAGNTAVAAALGLRAIGDFRYCGLFKTIKGTLFASRDSRIYTPLCALIAGTLAWLILSRP
jgi:hypothetical protein